MGFEPGLQRVVAGVLALAAIVAPGRALGAESAEIQAVLSADGGGLMVVNSQSNPREETWSWDACAPDLSNCSPFASGRTVTTAGAAAETVFRATSSAGAVALSPVWHGNIASVAPPSVTGAVRANELVTPVPGAWSGGWDGNVDLMQLAACRTARGTRCITLTNSHYPDGCAHGAAVIDPQFTGRYLRVADEALGPNPAFPSYAVLTPYLRDVWAVGPRTAAAIVGRIGPATGPRAARCGPPPLGPPKASLSKDGTATVECSRGCHAVLIAASGSRTRRATSFVIPFERTSLGIPQGLLARLGPGRVHMTLRVDGRVIAKRTVLIG